MKRASREREREEERKRERSRRKYMTREELTMSACVQRKQSTTTTHLPTHSCS
jgi:hypothetical protein